MSNVTIPAQGTGDTTPKVSTDLVSGEHYQHVKLADGTVGGSQPAIVDPSGALRVGGSISAAILSGYVGASIPGGYIGASIAGGYAGASVANFPTVQNISGYVGASVANLTASQQVLGFVGASVTNFPATQPVSGYLGASVANLPAVQAISGYIGASVTDFPSLFGASVSNFPTLIGASVSDFPTLFGASVSNLPAIQPVSGSVSVVNFPAIQQVEIASQAGQIGASVSNFPATQPVSGSVAITNLPVGQSVLGYLGASVTNFPTLIGASVSDFPTLFGASVSNLPVGQSVIGYVGASVTNFPTLIGASVSDFPLLTGASVSNFPTVFGASVSNLPALQAASASGTITANGGSLVLQTTGAPSVSIQVSGTWQLDLVCELSMDGSTWSNPVIMWEIDRLPSYQGHMQLGMNAIGGATSRNGQYRAMTNGAQYVRLFAKAAGGTPGTATVSLIANPQSLPFPSNGYALLAMDAVAPTGGTITCPIMPAPPPGWGFDVANHYAAGWTQTNQHWEIDLADDYGYANFQNTGSLLGGAGGAGGGSGSYVGGEGLGNCINVPEANWIRPKYVITGWNSTGTNTSWWFFVPAVAIDDVGFLPFQADQTAASDAAQNPNRGVLTGNWKGHGAFLLGTDAVAGANGGKLRRGAIDQYGNQLSALVAPKGRGATGGASRAKNINIGASVKQLATIPCVLKFLSILNSQGATAFVQLFDLASGSVTAGTTVADMEFEVPANTTMNVPLPPEGIAFTTAISIFSSTAEGGGTGSAAGVNAYNAITS